APQCQKFTYTLAKKTSKKAVGSAKGRKRRRQAHHPPTADRNAIDGTKEPKNAFEIIAGSTARPKFSLAGRSNLAKKRSDGGQLTRATKAMTMQNTIAAPSNCFRASAGISFQERNEYHAREAVKPKASITPWPESSANADVAAINLQGRCSAPAKKWAAENANSGSST